MPQSLKTDQFELASGSVVGANHTWRGFSFIGENNQDSLLISLTPSGCVVGIVSDGCGSGEKSEFGSALMCSLAFSSISRNLSGSGDLKNWETVRLDIASELRCLAFKIHGSPWDYFLATINGFIIGPETTTLFRIGDGYDAVNEDLQQYGPYPGNIPPYLAYHGVIDTDNIPDIFNNERLLSFSTKKFLTKYVNSIMVATDGLSDFIEASIAEKTLPGRPSQPIGKVSRLWEDDTFFSNEFALEGFLRACNTKRSTLSEGENPSIINHPGLLSDDMTVIVARRRNQESRE